MDYFEKWLNELQSHYFSEILRLLVLYGVITAEENNKYIDKYNALDKTKNKFYEGVLLYREVENVIQKRTGYKSFEELYNKYQDFMNENLKNNKIWKKKY